MMIKIKKITIIQLTLKVLAGYTNPNTWTSGGRISGQFNIWSIPLDFLKEPEKKALTHVSTKLKYSVFVFILSTLAFSDFVLYVIIYSCTPHIILFIAMNNGYDTYIMYNAFIPWFFNKMDFN